MQALNNWGLVLQELSTMRSTAERLLLVQQSVAKFRRAIRLRPEFDRACYNLGTVYYAHACSLQNEAQNQVRLLASHTWHVSSDCHLAVKTSPYFMPRENCKAGDCSSSLDYWKLSACSSGSRYCAFG